MTDKIHPWLEGLSEEKEAIARKGLMRAMEILEPHERMVLETSINHPEATTLEIARAFKDDLLATMPEPQRTNAAHWENEYLLRRSAAFTLAEATGKLEEKYSEFMDILVNGNNIGRLTEQHLPELTSFVDLSDRSFRSAASLAGAIIEESGDNLEQVSHDMRMFPSYLKAVALGDVVPDITSARVMIAFANVDQGSAQLVEADTSKKNKKEQGKVAKNVRDVVRKAIIDAQIDTHIGEILSAVSDLGTDLEKGPKYKKFLDRVAADKRTFTEEKLEEFLDAANLPPSIAQLVRDINNRNVPRVPANRRIAEYTMAQGGTSIKDFMEGLRDEWEISQREFAELFGMEQPNYRKAIVVKQKVIRDKFIDNYVNGLDLEGNGVFLFHLLSRGDGDYTKAGKVIDDVVKKAPNPFDDKPGYEQAMDLMLVEIASAQGTPEKDLPSSATHSMRGKVSIHYTRNPGSQQKAADALFPADKVLARRAANAFLGISEETRVETFRRVQKGELTIGEGLRSIRLSDRMSIKDFADSIPVENQRIKGPGYSAAYYGDIERGKPIVHERNGLKEAIAKRIGISSAKDLDDLDKMLKGQYRYPEGSRVAELDAEKELPSTSAEEVTAQAPQKARRMK